MRKIVCFWEVAAILAFSFFCVQLRLQRMPKKKKSEGCDVERESEFLLCLWFCLFCVFLDTLEEEEEGKFHTRVLL
jgi:hypothetical protein